MIEIFLVLIAGIVFGAINFLCFCFGYYVRSKKKEESDGVVVDEHNKELLAQIANFNNYHGGK